MPELPEVETLRLGLIKYVLGHKILDVEILHPKVFQGEKEKVIGSTVKVEMDGEVDILTIVGRVEANPAKKKISNESPLGSALLGAKKGEVVEVATPIVRYKCKILEIK